jgi:hypothetical protein
VIGDGAPWIRNIAEELSVKLTMRSNRPATVGDIVANRAIVMGTLTIARPGPWRFIRPKTFVNMPSSSSSGLADCPDEEHPPA